MFAQMSTRDPIAGLRVSVSTTAPTLIKLWLSEDLQVWLRAEEAQLLARELEHVLRELAAA